MGMQPDEFWTHILPAVGPTPVSSSCVKEILASVHGLFREQLLPAQGCAGLCPFSAPYSDSFDFLTLIPKTNVIIWFSIQILVRLFLLLRRTS